MTEVVILVERVEGGWVATANDEVGKLTSAFSVTKEASVQRVMRASRKLIGDDQEVLYREEELSDE